MYYSSYWFNIRGISIDLLLLHIKDICFGPVFDRYKPFYWIYISVWLCTHKNKSDDGTREQADCKLYCIAYMQGKLTLFTFIWCIIPAQHCRMLTSFGNMIYSQAPSICKETFCNVSLLTVVILSTNSPYAYIYCQFTIKLKSSIKQYEFINIIVDILESAVIF